MLLPSAPRDLDTNRSQAVKEMHAEGPRVPDDTAEQRHSTHSQWAVMQARNRLRIWSLIFVGTSITFH